MATIVCITHPINAVSMTRLCSEYRVVDGRLVFERQFVSKEQAIQWLLGRANYLAQNDSQLLDMYCSVRLNDCLEYEHLKAEII